MPSVVICGAQWGDEGKGKIIDYLTERSDMVVRAQGGNNAGHTVIVNNKKYSFHLLPSGVLNRQKINIIGNGVAFDPRGFLDELAKLNKDGFSGDNIIIDPRAHVIFPYHKIIDRLEEEKRGELKIGTTKKGIGPCYMDKVERSGLRIEDLIDEDELKTKLKLQLERKNEIITKLYGGEPIEFEKLFNEYLEYGNQIKPFVKDTTIMIYDYLNCNKKVLFEGAQGSLLDLDLGTYPYVTSSHPTSGGFPVGAGIGPNMLEEVLGIVKAYTTRVGYGPFPTELFDETGNRIRTRGHEYGTTTGRERRCGWLDLVMLKYTARINGFTSISLMLLDVLSGFEKIKVCTEYEIDGKKTNVFPSSLKDLSKAKPIYKELNGWMDEIDHITEYDKLPEGAKEYIKFIEEYLDLPVSIVSIGPGREQTIIRKNII